MASVFVGRPYQQGGFLGPLLRGLIPVAKASVKTAARAAIKNAPKMAKSAAKLAAMEGAAMGAQALTDIAKGKSAKRTVGKITSAQKRRLARAVRDKLARMSDQKGKGQKGGRRKHQRSHRRRRGNLGSMQRLMNKYGL